MGIVYPNAHDLPKFKALLVGEQELTRDEALTWVGHIFGPEHSRDIIDWYFGGFDPDQPFNREALLNHVECNIEAQAATLNSAKTLSAVVFF